MSAENTSAPRRDDEEATDEPPNAFMDALHAYANALDALDLAKDSLANARIAAETAATAGSLSIGMAHDVYWAIPKVHAKWLAIATGHKSAHTFVQSCPPRPLDRSCPLCGAPVYAASRTEWARLNDGRARFCESCEHDEGLVLAERRRRHHETYVNRLLQLRAMPYRDYLLTPEWDERRRAAVRRARGACQVCNARTRLDVHHRTYERLGQEFATDLIALCRSCHGLFHAQGKLAS